MSWLYVQSTGELCDASGQIIAKGYSGFGKGKNNPDLQQVPDIGPIPCGIYEILPPRDTPTHGPFVLPLQPDAANQMFERSGFLIHGDSIKMPGTASYGCIIMPRAIREGIWASQDHQLKVVSGLSNNAEAVQDATAGEN